MCHFCNFFAEIDPGAVICGAEITRLSATDHGAEVPRTHKQSSESSNLPLIFLDLFRIENTVNHTSNITVRIKN